ncbi:MAG TPA: PBP1A family penicillin-binding protein [Candidatus Paceibacterota bacterium]|nr:PBP1A family penicillin-binding protein [Candidatus Paceibacterota bacterium]
MKKTFNYKKLIGIVFVVVLIFVVWSLFYFIQLVKDLPHPEKLTDLQPTQSTKIYDRTGEILLYEIHGQENRTVLAPIDIPDYISKAVVAVEDQGFYQHSAIDWKSIVRAFFANLIKGRITQGGSTITQQLVKNVFLTPEKTIERKLKELILSYWIEKNYTKDEILVMYLNQIPLGSNAYGIEAASRLYFGKGAKDITLAQSAVLAALIQAPSFYSPWGVHIKDLENRKNYVLDQMEGLGYIDKTKSNEAKQEKIVFQPQSIGSIKAPHFVMMVRDYIINKYGEELVENGGLKVITSLDWKQQEIAERVVKEGASRNKELYKGENASLVSQDPKTGQILAMVGSANYFDKTIDGNFNVASQGLRQPGSAFKPFAYLTAFEKGYTPDTIVFDTPTEFTPNNPNCPIVVDYNNENNQCFHPHNFDNEFRGPVTLKQALAQSLNIPSVKVLYLAGIKDTIETAKKMGITTLEDPSKYGLALVLGGGAVKLSELVGAYSVFSQEGIKHNSSFILKVEDNNKNTLEQFIDSANQVIEPQYTKIINSILSDSELRSGLFQSSINLTNFNGYQVALKTGTTNDYRDAWVVGYTPFITVGVWSGNSDYKPMQKQGGSILAAVPIWSAFLKEVINQYPPEKFASPDPIISSKPMFNGQYIVQILKNGINFPNIHDILYYIDKNNPTSDVGQNYNPSNDYQFNNWEIPAINWARINIPNFDIQYNK